MTFFLIFVTDSPEAIELTSLSAYILKGVIEIIFFNSNLANLTVPQR